MLRMRVCVMRGCFMEGLCDEWGVCIEREGVTNEYVMKKDQSQENIIIIILHHNTIPVTTSNSPTEAASSSSGDKA